MERVDTDAILDEVNTALSSGDWNRAVELIEALRPPDQAEVFHDLLASDQDELLPRLDLEDSADILKELEEDEAADIASRLDPGELALILDEMESDEAADLLGDMNPAQAIEVLAAMEEPEKVLPLLVHADTSAGGLMTSAKITLHTELTAEEALEHLRVLAPSSEDVYYLFVVDADVCLVGVVSLRQLVISSPSALVQDIMDRDVISVEASADQELAARLMARYDLIALPVVDAGNHLLGIITHDDLVEVLEEEATEDIYRLGGVPDQQAADAPLPLALRSRLPWLVLNLGTALISAVVLSLFEGTIARVAVLAAFFPMVAGVSGSAGTQTLTVTVRRLALGELRPRESLQTLGREVLIGLCNGVTVGAIVSIIALLWKGTPTLGFVAGAAILLNMIAAAVAGVLVPVSMQSLKFDPALASPILVTTVTDTVGYFIYLGLATLAITRLA